MKTKIFASTMAVILALCAVPFQAAQGRTVSLDLRQRESTRAARSLLGAADRADGTLRRFNLDAGAADVGDVAVGDELEFTLFDDVTLVLKLDERMQSPLGGDVFLASASSYDGVKNAVVLRTCDGLTVDVRDFANDRVYKVISTASGVTVQEIEPVRGGHCGCDALEAPSVGAEEYDGEGCEAGEAEAAPTPAGGRTRTLLGAAAEQSSTCIDILVAFDRNAAAYANRNGGGITNFAQVAVQKINAALANTGLDESFRFRLVGVTRVNVAAGDVHEALYAIRDGQIGWADIKDFRETVGADIVTTLIDTGSAYGTTGVGWSLKDESRISSFGDSAYNVCAIRSVAQSDTMAHECGHNLGAGHADTQDTDPGPQLYSYSSGYFFTGDDGNRYSTIMAYEQEDPIGDGATAIPYFSSPDYTYSGVPVGDTARHDNTRTISRTYSAASKWRRQVIPTSYDVFFSPEAGAVFSDSITVTLTPGKAGTPIRYTLDGSTPTTSSTLYTRPITLTQTTTIRAIAVTDDVPGPVFEATYSVSDLGVGLDAPQLHWRTSDSHPWTFQTDDTYDGVDAARSYDDGGNWTNESWLVTTVTGPTLMSFRYKTRKYIATFSVLVDDQVVYEDTEDTTADKWILQEVSIPAGMHTVKFMFQCWVTQESGGRRSGRYNGFNGAWLDTIQFDALSRPPWIEPGDATGAGEAFVFEGEQMVSINKPNDDGAIYFTLDGSDPTGEGALRYDGPVFITDSTIVRAVGVQPGKEPSAIVEQSFVKNSKAGEWTMNGDSAFARVQEDGRMIAELYWNYPGCGWSARLEPIITDPVFTTWAELNGVYLLADSWGSKPGASGSRFWSLYNKTELSSQVGGSVYYPTFVFAAAGDVGTALGAMIARDDGAQSANGIIYEGTVRSLVECFSTYLDYSGAPPVAPVASVTSAHGQTFPFRVQLTNPNAYGEIYYTLDGSAPTRENGIRYTSTRALMISEPGTTLKAAVWPDSTSGISISSEPLIITYKAVETFEALVQRLRQDGLVIQNDANPPWIISTDYESTIMAQKDASLSYLGTTTLKGYVSTKGILSFDYMAHLRYTISTFKLRVNGTEVLDANWRSNFTSFQYEIDDENGAEIEWEYSYYAPGEANNADSGCWIKNLAWTPFMPPRAVTGLTGSNGEYDYGALVRWEAADGATSYNIYRSEMDDFNSATLVGNTTFCRFWDTAPGLGRGRYYFVRAVNRYGEGEPSNSVRAASSALFIAFDANGGEGYMEDVDFSPDTRVLLPPNSFERVGYVFEGWSQSPDGPFEFLDNQEIQLYASTTLYACWSFTGGPLCISFDANGGDGSMEEQVFMPGESVILLPNTFVRDGYEFAGWALEPEGRVVYSDCYEVLLTTSTRLYACWREMTTGPTMFEFEGDAPWTQEPDGSWKSGAIGDNQRTAIKISFSGRGTLTFDWSSYSEAGWDKLTFYCDGNEVDYLSGPTGWGTLIHAVETEGVHEFKWEYKKDGNGTVEPDCGWIRNVEWTPSPGSDTPPIENPIQDVSPSASVEEVNAAVDGSAFADAGVKDVIGGDAVEYNNFRSWAEAMGAAAVVASPHAAASYVLGSATLFQNEPEIALSDVQIGGDDGEPGAMSLSVTVKDGEDPMVVASEKVRELFQATTELGNWEGEGARLEPVVEELTPGQSSTLEFKVRFGGTDKPRAFLRIRK